MRPTLKKYKHPTRTELKWVLRWDEGGRRKRQYFTKTDEARGVFERKNSEWLAMGAQSGSMTDDQRLEALDCYKRLQQWEGVTLRDCVDRMIKELEHNRKQKSIAVADALDEFLAWKRRSNKRDRTVTSLEHELSAFFSGRLNKQLGTIGRKACEAWILGPVRDRTTGADTSDPSTGRTQRNRKARLHAFFAWALKKKLIDLNPVQGIECAELDEAEPEILTLDECRRLLAATQDFNAGMMMPYTILGLFCGIRPAELSRLTWENVSFEDRTVTITGAAAKLRARRNIEIPSNALEWLISYALKGTPIFPSNARKSLEAIRESAGLTPWKQDCMRHTALSARLALGISEGEVATWAGNSPDILHRHYKGLMSRKQAEAFWAIVPTESNVVEFDSEATA